MPRQLKCMALTSTIVVIGLATFCAKGGGADRSSINPGTPRIRAQVIDVSDHVDLRQWAERMSRGEDLVEWAARLGVAPRLDSVVDMVTKGFSTESREVVREAFRKELFD